MSEPFMLGITRDLLGPDGAPVYRGFGLDVLAGAAEIRHAFLAEHHPEVKPEQLSGLDAVVSLSPCWTRETFQRAERLVAVLRFGVGYDQVDVDACTAADVALCTSVGATSHSMAEAIVTWMLALTHRVLDKDRLMRE